MPFWKKSEDPWDYAPEKPPRPAEPGPEDKDYAPSLMNELRDWNEERKEKKRQREAPPPSMACPWCGQEMEVGYVTGTRGVHYHRGMPTTKRLWLGTGPDNTMRVDAEGGLLTPYCRAWFCRTCRRMVLEFLEEALEADTWETPPAENSEEQTVPADRRTDETEDT